MDWDRIRKEKDAKRDRLAMQPFDEKLKTLERLHERTVAIAGPQRPRAKGAYPTANVQVAAPSEPRARQSFGIFGVSAPFAMAVTSRSNGQPRATVPAPTTRLPVTSR